MNSSRRTKPKDMHYSLVTITEFKPKDRCTDESQEPSSVMTASGRASSRARNERVGGNAPQAALLSWGAPGRISAYTGNRTTS
jgi:hypothetical protein